MVASRTGECPTTPSPRELISSTASLSVCDYTDALDMPPQVHLGTPTNGTLPLPTATAVCQCNGGVGETFWQEVVCCKLWKCLFLPVCFYMLLP